MEFNTLLISDKKTLSFYKDAILELFSASFGKDLTSEIWEWAYILNPNGDPIVSLYFYEDKLVGHYAIIPIKLKHHNSSDALLSGLSMTTMVDSKYRKHGIFVKQANEVFLAAKRLSYDLIYGFPNKNSAPGFMKRLGWTLDESYEISTFHNGIVSTEICTKTDKEKIEFDLFNLSQNKWRLTKPGNEYVAKDGLIFKSFEDEIDVLSFNGDCDLLEPYKKLNILTTISAFENKAVEKTPYIFGYKIFNEALVGAKFKVELIMSDIF